jgi:hypothetical protein
MSRVNDQARSKLESAIADLVSAAQSYPQADAASWRTRDLLKYAREYGRALNRVETLRSK